MGTPVIGRERARSSDRPSAIPWSRGITAPCAGGPLRQSNPCLRQPLPTMTPAPRSPARQMLTDRAPDRSRSTLWSTQSACVERAMNASLALVPLLACLLGAGRGVAAEPNPAPAAPANAGAAGSELADVDASGANGALVVAAAAPVRWSVSGALTEGGYRLSLARGPVDLACTSDRAGFAAFDRRTLRQRPPVSRCRRSIAQCSWRRPCGAQPRRAGARLTRLARRSKVLMESRRSRRLSSTRESAFGSAATTGWHAPAQGLLGHSSATSESARARGQG